LNAKHKIDAVDLVQLHMQKVGRKRMQTSGRPIDCMDQIPTLIDWEVTIYPRIAVALAADIESGPLLRGRQLPPLSGMAKPPRRAKRKSRIVFIRNWVGWIVVHVRYFLHVDLSRPRGLPFGICRA
jgi:hypothetical protein